MIQDKLVVELLDANLSMKFQVDPELTLEKATTAEQQSALVKNQLDTNLSMKLQLDPELTLEKATTATQQSALVKNQQEVVRGEHKPPSVDAVQSKYTTIREISDLKAIDIPLQYRSHPDNFKNKLVATRYGIPMGNSTAQQGRQCATNVTLLVNVHNKQVSTSGSTS